MIGTFLVEFKGKDLSQLGGCKRTERSEGITKVFVFKADVEYNDKGDPTFIVYDPNGIKGIKSIFELGVGEPNPMLPVPLSHGSLLCAYSYRLRCGFNALSSHTELDESDPSTKQLSKETDIPKIAVRFSDFMNDLTNRNLYSPEYGEITIMNIDTGKHYVFMHDCAFDPQVYARDGKSNYSAYSASVDSIDVYTVIQLENARSKLTNDFMSESTQILANANKKKA